MDKMLKITNRHVKFRNGKNVIVACEVNNYFMFVHEGYLDKIRFSFHLN